jgi:hypothetical protein
MAPGQLRTSLRTPSAVTENRVWVGTCAAEQKLTAMGFER